MLKQILANFKPIAQALNAGQLTQDEKNTVRTYARNIILRCGYEPELPVDGERYIDEENLGVIVDTETSEVKIGEEAFIAPTKVIDYLCQVSGERDEFRSVLGLEAAETILINKGLKPEKRKVDSKISMGSF